MCLLFLSWVTRVSKKLPSPEQVSAEVDVEALEASANLLGTKYHRKTKSVVPSPGAVSPGYVDVTEGVGCSSMKMKSHHMTSIEISYDIHEVTWIFINVWWRLLSLYSGVGEDEKKKKKKKKCEFNSLFTCHSMYSSHFG